MTAPCGTTGGYMNHIRLGTVPCIECVEARREWGRRWRFRIGRAHTLGRCPHCGSVFPAQHQCLGPRRTA